MPSQSSRVHIRPAAATDVPAVVQVHLRSFTGFFLTFLGPRFLRVLYGRMLVLPEAVTFVAEDQAGAVIGFVFGVTQQSNFYSALLRRHWQEFAVASLPPLLRRPGIALRLLRALNRPAEARAAFADGLLMSIAVLPQYQGMHVGGALLRAFVAGVRQCGTAAISLTTDRQNNEAANRFYLTNGFELGRSFVTRENRAMNEYVLYLRQTKSKEKSLEAA